MDLNSERARVQSSGLYSITQDRIQLWFFVNTVMKLRAQWRGEFLNQLIKDQLLNEDSTMVLLLPFLLSIKAMSVCLSVCVRLQKPLLNVSDENYTHLQFSREQFQDNTAKSRLWVQWLIRPPNALVITPVCILETSGSIPCPHWQMSVEKSWFPSGYLMTRLFIELKFRFKRNISLLICRGEVSLNEMSK